MKILGEPNARRYLGVLLTLPLAAYLLPLLFVRAPAFEQRIGTLLGPALDYAFSLGKQDAGIVIFGDSSALFGISPNQISAAVGIKTINLPNTVGSLPVVQDAALRQYLANNAPPRLLVLYFAPWNLNYTHEPANRFVHEGEEMLLRHGTRGQILAYARAHPLSILAFPLEFYSAVPKAALLHALLTRSSRASEVAENSGHMDLPDRGKAVQNSECVLPSELTQARSTASIREMTDAYRSAATEVLVYLAPVPSCRNVHALVELPYEAVAASPPKIMDPANFVADDQFVHLMPSAVPTATTDLLEAIRPRLRDAARAAR